MEGSGQVSRWSCSLRRDPCGNGAVHSREVERSRSSCPFLSLRVASPQDCPFLSLHSDTVSGLDDRESVDFLKTVVASLRALFCGCQRRSGGSILIRYFDSSALVKRYVREAGSDVVEGLLASGPAAISRLTEVEVTSALARRTRTGDCSVEERDVALAMLARDMDSFLVVELVAAVTRRESVAHSRLSLSVASEAGRCRRLLSGPAAIVDRSGSPRRSRRTRTAPSRSRGSRDAGKRHLVPGRRTGGRCDSARKCRSLKTVPFCRFVGPGRSMA